MRHSVASSAATSSALVPAGRGGGRSGGALASVHTSAQAAAEWPAVTPQQGIEGTMSAACQPRSRQGRQVGQIRQGRLA